MIACAASAAAEIASLPPSPLTASCRLAPGAESPPVLPGPDTATPEASPLTLIVSLPLVPSTMTLSAWPSPVAPPRVPARSTFTLLTSVPVRSLTLTTSAPPSALKSTRSTPAVSIVTLPGSRRNVRRFPFAERATRSATLAPLNTHCVGTVLAFDVSLPSPGSQTKVSSPAPSRATSLPPLPSIVSLPSPPIRRFAARAAGERVVPVSTVDCRRDACR